MWAGTSEVVVKCPVTGNVIPIGMELTESAFKRATLYGNSFTCSACGQVHAWKKDDAWVRVRSY
jgi:hypothetical protein